jgi:hypothetical protein
MKSYALFGAMTLAFAPGLARAVVVDYEDLSEGFLGSTFTHQGVTYRDVNNVSGFYADGNPFSAGDPGTDSIIENATLFYNDFPTYGSPINSMTFGNAFVVGDNLSIGALASVFMDLANHANAASLDIAFYENGPWGGIEYRLDALLNGQVVDSDNFLIADGGGRDNATYRTMSVGGVEFDSLHLYAMKNGSYTVPRGMIDNLTYAPVPEPASIAVLGLGAAAIAARRRRKSAR